MAQRLQVVSCVSCQVFQVQIEKKSTNKWTCKICNTKQSLKQVFHEGSGKECRTVVQQLNKKRQEEEVKKTKQLEDQLLQEAENPESAYYFEEGNDNELSWGSDFEEPENSERVGNTYQSVTLPKTSTWAKYCDDDDENRF